MQLRTKQFTFYYFFYRKSESSTIVYDQLAKYSNAVAMTEVTNIVLGLEDIKSNLTQMKTITNYLRNHASQLNDGKIDFNDQKWIKLNLKYFPSRIALRKVKKDLIYTLKECTTNAECSQLSSNVSNLDTNIDFNSVSIYFFLFCVLSIFWLHNLDCTI